jgi:hypothetical protein
LPGHDPWATQRTRVRQRSGYLRNPLTAGPGVCYVCRGPAAEPHTRCLQCEQHFRTSNGRTADVVVPISYAVKREQHAFNLASYKRRPGSNTVRADLLALIQVFIADHGRCLLNAARVSTFDGAAVVPSTRNRPGPHPLQLLIGSRLRLPWLQMNANTTIRPESRSFHENRFSVSEPAGRLNGAAVLLLDDTWTTGSRVESASCALRAAGAATVVAVVFGRHVNPDWEPWWPILKTVKKTPFDLDRCAVHSGRAG